ncbi:MAG: DUF4365 domain-containing protein [Sedimentisphaerales bacterium]|nr:DUF4365 domain-containing protein [Sedimentisphaerales bacterium]
MKYKKTKATSKAGVIFVEKVVNQHGSVFRPVHEEDDLGVDGFIELVKAEIASGRLIGVQIKAGDSYLAPSADEFVVNVDERHLDYWLNFMVPVIIVCYSPSKNIAAWVSVRDYVERERYNERLPVKQIHVPFCKKFDADALSRGIAGLAHARADERILLRSADMCLSEDVQRRHDGFQILANHPDSRELKITCAFARRLLMDPNIDTAKEALFIIGYGVGRRRWSGNPNSREEAEVGSFAATLCEDLSEAEIRRLLELCDEEAFSGPQGLGERLFDVICCCFDAASSVLDSVLRDPTAPMQRRVNALYLLYECDDGELEEARPDLLKDAGLRAVVEWMFSPSKENTGIESG